MKSLAKKVKNIKGVLDDFFHISVPSVIYKSHANEG